MNALIGFIFTVFLGFSQSHDIVFIADESYSVVNKQTLLNPENSVFNLSSNTLLGKLNYQLSYGSFQTNVNLSARSEGDKKTTFNWQLREIIWNHSVSEYWDFSLGKKRFKWGTGFYKNPAAFANVEKSPDDISDRSRKTEGREFVSLMYTRAESDFNLVYFPKKIEAFNVSEHELIAKYYMLWNEMDISLLANMRTDLPNRLGATVAYTMNDQIELHAEWMIQPKSEIAKHQYIEENSFQFYRANPYTITSNELVQKFLIGFNYTTSFGLNTIVEYSHNDEGYSSAEWKSLLKYADELNAKLKVPEYSDASKGNLMWLAHSVNHQKDYVFYRVNIRASKWIPEVIGLTNLADFSSYLMIGTSYELGSQIDVSVQMSKTIGSNKTDFGSLFQNSGLRLNLILYL